MRTLVFLREHYYEIAASMRIATHLGVLILAMAACSEPASAQTSFASSPDSDIDASDRGQQDALGFRQGSLIAVPIPSQNPTFDTGLALGAGYLFKADEKSSNSFIGLGGYGSTNGSRVYGVSTSLSFLEIVGNSLSTQLRSI